MKNGYSCCSSRAAYREYMLKNREKEKFNPNTPLFEELTDVKRKQINSIFI